MAQTQSPVKHNLGKATDIQHVVLSSALFSAILNHLICNCTSLQCLGFELPVRVPQDLSDVSKTKPTRRLKGLLVAMTMV